MTRAHETQELPPGKIDGRTVLGVVGTLVAVVSLVVSVIAFVKANRFSERQLRQERAIAERDLPQLAGAFYLERFPRGAGGGGQDEVFAAGGPAPSRDDFVHGKTFILMAVLTNTGKTAANVTWWTVDQRPGARGEARILGRLWPTTATVRFGIQMGPPPIRVEPFSQATIGIDLAEIVRTLRRAGAVATMSADQLQMRVEVAGRAEVVGRVPFKLREVPPNFGR